ncbi:hypothetical protein P168DRAFT_180221 [Aspergillus campestris IBT 28561]|uniref:Uncharacterized protein n=1 Tax=Aspergillus campestris (strain IBT 28561) TaxID=1392248 RepID=A0A2I1D052_ASPC2|nr:uncharacterized protein P168DRAFT_180221 [Aspergillus campestris IBT 28561]PKY03248.1 hypothetical protein P168DRAFT_180221 [Aspergillus campestris IBT 28561]
MATVTLIVHLRLMAALLINPIDSMCFGRSDNLKDLTGIIQMSCRGNMELGQVDPREVLGISLTLSQLSILPWHCYFNMLFYPLSSLVQFSFFAIISSLCYQMPTSPNLISSAMSHASS